jgi:MFS family permease
LWRHGPFARFFIGASLSVIGDWFNTVAIVVLTYRLSGEVSWVAVTIMAAVVPRVLLAPVGGILADRFPRRSLLVTLDCARAVVALLPLMAHDVSTLWLVYVAVALLQAGAFIYNPAQGAYVPHLVPDDLLEAANAAYASMRDIGMFVGPALAAAVLGLWGPAVAFWGNSLSFAVAAGLLLTLPRVGHGVTQMAGLRALTAGYATIVRRYPRLAPLYMCQLAYAVLVYLFQAIMVVYAKAVGQPTTFVGVLYAAAGVGGALGGFAMGRYLRRLPYAVSIGIYALSVPLLGALALVHVAGPALVLLACSTAAGTAGDVIYFVSVQRYVTPQERGRAFGLWFWCIAIGQLIGAALGVAVTLRTAIPALLGVGLGLCPLVLMGVLLSIRAEWPSRARPGSIVEGVP